MKLAEDSGINEKKVEQKLRKEKARFETHCSERFEINPFCKAPCDYSFVDVPSKGITFDIVGCSNSVGFPFMELHHFAPFQAEEPHGADNFAFILDFFATFLEMYPTYREMVVDLPCFIPDSESKPKASPSPGCPVLHFHSEAHGEDWKAQVPQRGTDSKFGLVTMVSKLDNFCGRHGRKKRRRFNVSCLVMFGDEVERMERQGR